MKMSIPLCTSKICGDDLEKLGKIIRKKYKKMIWFYRMIEKYADQIISYEYDDSSEDSELIVIMTFSDDEDPELACDSMQEKIDLMDHPVDVCFEINGQSIRAKVTLSE